MVAKKRGRNMITPVVAVKDTDEIMIHPKMFIDIKSAKLVCDTHTTVYEDPRKCCFSKILRVAACLSTRQTSDKRAFAKYMVCIEESS